MKNEKPVADHIHEDGKVRTRAESKFSPGSKKYKVLSEFTLDGVVMHANQAIMLTDAQAKEFAGNVECIDEKETH